MLIPLLKTQLLELASPELLEQGYCLRFVREQVEIRLAMPDDLDRAIVNPVIDPVRGDLQFAGDLRYGQEAGNATGMGLAAHAQQPVTQTNAPDGTGQDGRVLGGTMPLLRQPGRDLLVGHAFLGEL